jgi:hypothetical protein
MSEKNLNFPPIENGAPEHEMLIKQVQYIPLINPVLVMM